MLRQIAGHIRLQDTKQALEGTAEADGDGIARFKLPVG